MTTFQHDFGDAQVWGAVTQAPGGFVDNRGEVCVLFTDDFTAEYPTYDAALAAATLMYYLQGEAG